MPDRHLRGECQRPTALERFRNPLDLIKEDHFRLRHICALIDRISGRPSKEPGDVEQIRRFLRCELATHLADEEENLYPLLRKRCAPEDQLGRTLAMLSEDHVGQRASAEACLAVLDRLSLSGGDLSDAEADTLRAFADRKRRHLIVENAILLPLARARLLAPDLREMLAQMRLRREEANLIGAAP
jgi:hemerythrin-like domain-containing protein